MKKLVILSAVAALTAFAWTPIAQGAPFDTFVVDVDGMATPDDCDSGEAADFTSIQTAIDDPGVSDATKLNKRDVILVCPGTYSENVVVDKTVILQGVGGPVGYAIVDATGTTIEITADGVKIDNLEITNGGTSGKVILINSDGNEISHNWITGAREGIDIRSGNNNSVHHNIIGGTADDGIDVRNSSGNDIHHNTISGTGGEGIDLDSVSGGDNVVHHNTITMSVAVGIRVESDNNDIHHNTITDSGEEGIELKALADDNSVHDNIVTGSTDDGIESEGDRNVIARNFVCDNGGNDIEILAAADDNRVLGNTATNIVDSGTGTVEMNNSPCPNG